MQSLLIAIKASSFGIILFFFSLEGFAQSIDLSSDLLLIDSVSKQHVHHHEKRIYIYKNQRKTLKNSNPVSLIYGGSLYVYQNFVSQHLSADCLYDPSCSDFSKQVVKEYGLFKGGLLTFDRLNRCNRIAATDLDLGTMNLKTHRFGDPIKRYK
ncbi:MAG: membrane protein insertion efficiency factor YidD [Bacteroidota bacterium]|nr:membrane protein insertion efficiency factor YidD [Bacteroidota bacterium]